MSDIVTKTRNEGFFSRIWNAFKWVVMWFLLFICSFWVLYWNEWRVNLAELAKTATHITSETENISQLKGKLVSVSWVLKSDKLIWDTYIKPWKFLSINRNVEMYSWFETTEEEEYTNLWGSETTTITYEYDKRWTEYPPDHTSFEEPFTHRNPKKMIESITITADDLQIENFKLYKDIELPTGTTLTLTKDNTLLGTWMQMWENRLFKSYKNNFSNRDEPEIWDIRISYTVLDNPLENATVFGKLENETTISQFVREKDDARIYRALKWDRQEAISTLQTEHTIVTWILRMIWFFMMWYWLVTILTPLSVILDVVPFFGTLWEWAIKVFSFVVALILSIITVIVSIIIHNVWMLLWVILLSLYWIYSLSKKNKKLTTSQ